MAAKKQRTHKLLDKHPVFGSILTTGVFVVLFFITMSCLALALEALIPDGSVSSALSIVSTFLLISLLFLLYFRGETNGLLPGDYKSCGLIALLFVVYWTLSVILGIVLSGDRYGLPTIADIGNAFSAGFMEEVTSRGFIIMLLLRKKRTPKMILGSLFVTSAIFALIHAANLFSGADPVSTVIQVTDSFATGFSFGLLFVCSGSILPGTIIHTIHDIIAFSELDATTEEGVMVSGFSAGSAANTILCYAFAIFCFLYLKRDDIMKRTVAIWDKKWSGVKTAEGSSETSREEQGEKALSDASGKENP